MSIAAGGVPFGALILPSFPFRLCPTRSPEASTPRFAFASFCPLHAAVAWSGSGRGEEGHRPSAAPPCRRACGCARVSGVRAAGRRAGRSGDVTGGRPLGVREGAGRHGRVPQHELCPSSGASKGDIREKVWDYLEASGLAEFPRPVHHRIPNFKVRRPAAL